MLDVLYEKYDAMRAERDELASKLESLTSALLEAQPYAPYMAAMAEALGPMFKMICEDERAQNFVTTDVVLEAKGAKWTLTAQRENGKTPTERIAELDAKLVAVRAALLVIKDAADRCDQPGMSNVDAAIDAAIANVGAA
jgi:hypothetical protein